MDKDTGIVARIAKDGRWVVCGACGERLAAVKDDAAAGDGLIGLRMRVGDGAIYELTGYVLTTDGISRDDLEVRIDPRARQSWERDRLAACRGDAEAAQRLRDGGSRRHRRRPASSMLGTGPEGDFVVPVFCAECKRANRFEPRRLDAELAALPDRV